MEYEVEGATLLPATTVEKAVYPFLGKGKRIADVEQARASLERAYRNAGYQSVLVDIPEQKVDKGIVVLRVTESSVGRVRVLGARYYSQERILAEVPALAEGATPNFTEAQQQLEAVNRAPDRRVTPVFRPGTVAGTTDIDLNVEDKLPLHGSLELNNNYSPNTTPLRLVGTLRYDNLWQRQHSLTLQFQTSPADTNQVLAFSGSYVAPLPDSNNVIALYAVKSNSNVASAVGGSTVIGNGTIIGARYIMPLRGWDNFTHSVILGADYKHFGESLTLTGGSGAVQTPVTYYPFSLSYNGTRVDGAGNTQWSLGTLFALRGLYTNEGYFSNKRFGGQSNFSILRWDLQRTQSLPLEMSLFARVDGQVSSGPLIVNEQFLAGGATTVRGYLEAEALGDNGVHGSLELRSPALGALPDGMDLRLHAFTEGSHLTITDALPRQQNKFTLSSLGFGLRLNVRGLWTLGGNLAWPIHATSYTKAWSPRLLFTTALQF